MSKMTEKRLYEIFSIAIEEERKSQELYREGAELAGPGSQMSAMFKRLEVEEHAHEQVLLDDYAVFKKTISSGE